MKKKWRIVVISITLAAYCATLALLLTGCATTKTLPNDFQRVASSIQASKYAMTDAKGMEVEKVDTAKYFKLRIIYEPFLSMSGTVTSIRAQKLDEKNTKLSVRFERTRIVPIFRLPMQRKTRVEEMERTIIADIESRLN